MSRKIYRIKVEDIRVARKRPDGKLWDSGVRPLADVAPDIFVEIDKVGITKKSTSVAKNKYEHTFNEYLPVMAEEGEAIAIRVWDKDPDWGYDDLIGACRLVIEDEDLRNGFVELKFGSVEYLKLSFDFERPEFPRQPDPRISRQDYPRRPDPKIKRQST